MKTHARLSKIEAGLRSARVLVEKRSIGRDEFDAYADRMDKSFWIRGFKKGEQYTDHEVRKATLKLILGMGNFGGLAFDLCEIGISDEEYQQIQAEANRGETFPRFKSYMRPQTQLPK